MEELKKNHAVFDLKTGVLEKMTSTGKEKERVVLESFKPGDRFSMEATNSLLVEAADSDDMVRNFCCSNYLSIFMVDCSVCG